MNKIVKFTKAWKNYSAGDVAGFDQNSAEELISKHKVAVVHEPSDAQKMARSVLASGSEAELTDSIERARSDLEQRELAIDKRSQKLDERETNLTKAGCAVSKLAAKLDVEMLPLDAQIEAFEKFAVDLDARKVELDARETELKKPGSDASDADGSSKPPKQGGK